jgi:hypothetical protein
VGWGRDRGQTCLLENRAKKQAESWLILGGRGPQMKHSIRQKVQCNFLGGGKRQASGALIRCMQLQAARD